MRYEPGLERFALFFYQSDNIRHHGLPRLKFVAVARKKIDYQGLFRVINN